MFCAFVEIKNYLNYNLNLNGENIEITLDNKEKMKDILIDILKNNINIRKCELKTPTLREIFIEKAGDDNEKM